MQGQTIALVREEDDKDQRVKEVYRDIKESLRIPFVNVLFQAYAAVPRFLDFTWRRLRPSMLSLRFVDQATSIGSLADRGVGVWNIADHAAELRARNIGEADIRKMREIVDLFHQVDPRLLVIAVAVRLALAGEEVGGAGSSGPPSDEDKEKVGTDFRGINVSKTDERDAPLRVRTILEEIKTSAGLPFVNNDYRAMAAWPDWLEVWWRDCRPVMCDDRYWGLCRELTEAAHQAALMLPHQLNLASDLLDQYGVSAQERQRVAAVNLVFCETLPGLILNMAIARRGLAARPQNP
ncbi:MAG: hypothetical protein GIW99_05790 [Candidatus Eremiobacteraeota bacterium]|nr:hypothetical protein [Candidatus Eremiobacteraeota bacterium]MBC5827180.1 hypothetical protein [Candidatus Eremiobacteraeota bacterium]